MKYDYLLVGTGLFNAVFNSIATKFGKKCIAIEKENHVGGLCYTEKIDDIIVHKYGAHIFYTNNYYVWDYVKKYGEFNDYSNCPIAIYKGNAYNLPFNMNTFAKVFGITSPEEAKKIINEEAKKITQISNLEDKAISLVGKTIYEMFIKEYTEKQWGKDCKEMPPETIRRIPVRFTYNNNYYKEKYQGIPKHGYTNLIYNMFSGTEIKFNEIYDKSMSKIANKVIYTGAIDEYYDYKYGNLEWRSLEFTEKWYNTDNYQGNAVFNYTDKSVPYTRSIEHKHFYYKPSNKTIVSYETPVKWEKGMKKYYPFEDKNNLLVYNEYLNASKNEKNIVFCGRLGSYKYTNMQDTVINSMDLFARLEDGNI